MSKSPEKPLFHVTLSDRDEWVIEAEWPDSTLERVSIFRNHAAAADWIAHQSEAWLAARRIQNITIKLKQGAEARSDSATRLLSSE
jgi:hypothetical protein